MNELTNGKIVVGSTHNAINNAKVYGILNLRNLYLLNIIGKLLVNDKDLRFDQRQRLETLYNFIKYNDKSICNYIEKDLNSFKKVNLSKEPINNLNLSPNNTLPTVDNSSQTLTTNYSFTRDDFTRNFTTVDSSQPETVRINSLPSVGVLSFNNVNIVAGFEFNIANVSMLRYTLANTSSPVTYTFNFQTSNNNSNKLFSNMATMTLNIQAAVNQPPSSVGNNSITIANAATYTFTVADFTTNTTPAYQDPEGDAASMLRVTALPTDGNLQFNGVNVTVNQSIPFTGITSITSGAFRYVASSSNTAQDTETFTFQISDTGSNTFVG